MALKYEVFTAQVTEVSQEILIYISLCRRDRMKILGTSLLIGWRVSRHKVFIWDLCYRAGSWSFLSVFDKEWWLKTVFFLLSMGLLYPL